EFENVRPKLAADELANHTAIEPLHRQVIEGNDDARYAEVAFGGRSVVVEVLEEQPDVIGRALERRLRHDDEAVAHVERNGREVDRVPEVTCGPCAVVPARERTRAEINRVDVSRHVARDN